MDGERRWIEAHHLYRCRRRRRGAMWFLGDRDDRLERDQKTFAGRHAEVVLLAAPMAKKVSLPGFGT
jgi:hypothetical protein